MTLLLCLLACTGEVPLVTEPASEPTSPPLEVPEPTAGPARGADGLVEAPGVELVRSHCAACHSTQIIQQNHMSKARWSATITWMQETQGLWDLPSAQRTAIVEYLGTHQGASAEENVESPWASPTYEPNPIW